jgi:DNA repair exonuclease SbcCD nuclease subunit
MKFLHTADWQLGKPFAGTKDPQKRAILQNERFAVINRIGDKVRETNAEFVVVAGDLFDSPSVTKPTVSAACSAIGAIGVPVYVIPGNHDHGGPGSLWIQDFFLRECRQLSPNLTVLLNPEPVELPSAVLFPCPLLRRHEIVDPTVWLRATGDLEERFGDKPRIVIAHGSVLDFDFPSDQTDSEGNNILNLNELEQDSFDYMALGDWHGAKRVSAKAWYSGTPEFDRFAKGEGNNPGNVLVVEAARGVAPRVDSLPIGGIGWHEVDFTFADDSGLDRLRELVDAKVGNRVNRDLLRLRLSGPLGMGAMIQLDRMIEAWSSRLIRIKLENGTVITPSAAEMDGLSGRTGDPLVSRVASKLLELASGTDEQAAVARVALRELYTVCNAA